MSLADLVTTVIVFAVLLALAAAAFRMDAHWVSRDRRRFICRAQLIDHTGYPLGGWLEYRFHINPSGQIEGRRRGVIGARNAGTWTVRARSDMPPRRKEVFLLHPTGATEAMLAVRMPASSALVEVLDRLATG